MQDIKTMTTNNRIPMLILVICIILLGRSTNCFAQGTIKAIKINDTLPDIIIQKLIRHPNSPMHTKDLYKDGLLLINFWATWCEPCQTELQFLAKEIEKHPEVKVLSVGYESKALVEWYLKKHSELADSKLQFTYEDKYFVKAFFHQGLPHNIWIDGKGIVKAITSGEEIKSTNIAAFLKNSNNNFYEKKETPFDFRKPAHIPDSVFTYRAIFSKDFPGVTLSGASISPQKMVNQGMSRFFCFNNLLDHLLWDAAQMPGWVPIPELMEVHTLDSVKYFWPGQGKDPAKYSGPKREEWARQHRYTYELRLPKPVPDSVLFQRVISDLEMNLNIKISKEPRLRNCMIVTCNLNDARLKSTRAPDNKYYLGRVGNTLVIKNVPIAALFQWIPSVVIKDLRNQPYINRTGIDFLLTANLDLGESTNRNFTQEQIETLLNDQLGFKFEMQKTMFPILIIKDLN